MTRLSILETKIPSSSSSKYSMSLFDRQGIKWDMHRAEKV